MKDGDNVVTYRSEADRAIDQWIWHGGGWQYLLLVVAVVLVVAFAAWLLELRDKKRRGF